MLSEAEKKNFVPYEKLVAKRDELYAQWLANPKDLKLNMYHLILAVNTYIPPLRLDFVGMEIYPHRVGRESIAGPPPENTTNYLWETVPGHWSIVVNRDKIENKRKAKNLPRKIMDLDTEVEGVTNGKKLQEIINMSLKVAPRNYVLIGIRTKQPMVVSAYDTALKGMFAPQQPSKIC